MYFRDNDVPLHSTTSNFNLYLSFSYWESVCEDRFPFFMPYCFILPSLSFQSDHFAVWEAVPVDSEADKGAFLMPSLDAGSTWIDMEEV